MAKPPYSGNGKAQTLDYKIPFSLENFLHFLYPVAA
jgi:hypothetical protein